MSGQASFPAMVSHLRACAVDLVRRASNGGVSPRPKGNGNAHTKIDKSVLTISEPKRIRCKGAPTLCRKPALPDLRTLTLPRPPRALRAISRAQLEGER